MKITIDELKQILIKCSVPRCHRLIKSKHVDAVRRELEALKARQERDAGRLH